MNSTGWIIILEEGQLWTASLRSCLARTNHDPSPTIRGLPETPRIADLDRTAPLFLCVEVRQDNVVEALMLLSAIGQLPHAGAGALLDRGAGSSELAAAALEAGACVAVTSPRSIDRVAAVALHSLRLARQSLTNELSSQEIAFRRLPWQTEPWRLG